MPSLSMIGVNNRNLATFEVDSASSRILSEFIPKEFVSISESGIRSPQEITSLEEYGFQGFLIGESFMKTTDPGKAAAEFVAELKATKNISE